MVLVGFHTNCLLGGENFNLRMRLLDIFKEKYLHNHYYFTADIFKN